MNGLSERMSASLRVGTDLLQISELDRLSERPWFLAAWYSASELEYARSLGQSRRREYLAGRFAAKEAVAKLLGARLFGEVTPRQIDVGRGASGEPMIRLSGAAKTMATDLSIEEIAISISHKKDVVFVIVISS
jgi:phosphopantetheine--protein transferase-like protein